MIARYQQPLVRQAKQAVICLQVPAGTIHGIIGENGAERSP